MTTTLAGSLNGLLETRTSDDSRESKQQNRQREDDVVGGFDEQPLTRVIPRALAVRMRLRTRRTESASG
jgi:hypothetical protein